MFFNSCDSHRAVDNRTSEPARWDEAKGVGTYSRSVDIPNEAYREDKKNKSFEFVH